MSNYTRKQYLAKECTHSDYYNQFVTNSIKYMVISRIGKDRIISSIEQDEHLNNIPLSEWDRLAPYVTSGGLMKELGDVLTLSGQVCILKEAAKQIAENNQSLNTLKA